MGFWRPQTSGSGPSESEYMPLLRSLADSAARVAINMPLLTELFASPHLRGAFRVRRARGQTRPGREAEGRWKRSKPPRQSEFSQQAIPWAGQQESGNSPELTIRPVSASLDPLPGEAYLRRTV
jgi:hypothetical protein